MTTEWTPPEPGRLALNPSTAEYSATFKLLWIGDSGRRWGISSDLCSSKELPALPRDPRDICLSLIAEGFFRRTFDSDAVRGLLKELDYRGTREMVQDNISIPAILSRLSVRTLDGKLVE